MTIEQMKAAIEAEQAKSVPAGFNRLKNCPDNPAYFADGGWQVAPYSAGWRACCISTANGFHIAAEAPTPREAIDALRIKMGAASSVLAQIASREFA